MNLKVEFT